MSVSSKKRFILGGDDDSRGVVSPVSALAVKTTGRRKGRRSNKYSLRWSLQELDETVASAGKMYRSPRRPGEDDSIGSNCSNTIITSDGHAIYTHRNLIENMPQVRRGGRSTEKRSVQSHRTNPSNISESRGGSRQKRGSSLERTISRTILRTAAAGLQQAHFLVSPDGNSSSSETPVDFILHDLYEVDTAIQSETNSVRISVHSNPPQETIPPQETMQPESLLGPLPSDVPEDKLFLADTTTTRLSAGNIDLFFQGKSRDFEAVTPVTSEETPPQAEGSDASPAQGFHFDHNESLDDPFAQIELLQVNSSPWSFSNGDEDLMEGNEEAVLPKEESFFLTSMAYNTKRAAISKQATPEPASADPSENFFNVDEAWTTFEGNAFDNSFPASVFDTKESYETSSRGSPSSIVDFGMQMRRERELSLAFSQSTESAFSSSVLTSTMAAI
jgi:hypothetical protein